MTYSDKLKDPRWQKRRLEIFARDEWKCCACMDDTKPLHAHHKEYVGEPWETPQDLIQTLCESCHDLLPKHPKGGVWWTLEDGYCAFSYSHCPQCGSHDLRDKGSFEKCNSCGCRLYPEGFPEPK